MIEIRPCPACGGDPRTNGAKVDREFGALFSPGYRLSCPCGVSGPWGKTSVEMEAGWNALPRWDWQPAGEPVPPGADDGIGTRVLAGWPGYVCEAEYDGETWWREYGAPETPPTHWMPLPPPPGDAP